MKILQQISLFEGLDKPFLKRLAEKGVYRTFYLNNYIYHINDPVQEGCFVLLEGSVKIVKQHVAKEPWNPPFRSLRMDMTILSPVQLFGEEELLVASSKRSYSVVCITSIVQLLEIPQEVFASVMRSHTKLNGDAEIKKFETERASLHNRLLAKSR